MINTQTTVQRPQDLSVSLTLPEDHPKHRTILHLWDLDAQNRRDSITSDDALRERLSTCSALCFNIQMLLKDLFKKEDYALYICQNDTPQAFMLIRRKEDCIHVVNLVSNPRNIAPTHSQESCDPIVKGAGKSLMHKAISLSIELENKDIRLASYPSSVSFYEKLGFEKIYTDPIPDNETDCVAMILSAEKIEVLYPQLFPPNMAA